MSKKSQKATSCIPCAFQAVSQHWMTDGLGIHSVARSKVAITISGVNSNFLKCRMCWVVLSRSQIHTPHTLLTNHTPHTLHILLSQITHTVVTCFSRPSPGGRGDGNVEEDGVGILVYQFVHLRVPEVLSIVLRITAGKHLHTKKTQMNSLHTWHTPHTRGGPIPNIRYCWYWPMQW